jgi:hypothetical protein
MFASWARNLQMQQKKNLQWNSFANNTPRSRSKNYHAQQNYAVGADTIMFTAQKLYVIRYRENDVDHYLLRTKQFYKQQLQGLKHIIWSGSWCFPRTSQSKMIHADAQHIGLTTHPQCCKPFDKWLGFYFRRLYLPK